MVARLRLSPLFVACFVLVAGGLSTSAAHAQADSYQGTIDAAVDEYASGRWEEALALFRQAHTLRPSARTLRGIGMASFETRHYADAIRYLSEAATETARPLTSQQQHEVEQLIARAQAFVTHLTVVIVPAHATLSADGHQVAGDARRSVLLDAGEHQLVASAPGYESSVRSVHLTPGAEDTLDIDLSPRHRPVAQGAGAGAPELPAAAPSALHATASSGSPRTRFGRLKYAALGVTLAGLVMTAVSVAKRSERASALRAADCDNFMQGSAMEAGCHKAYERAVTWERAAIASAVVSASFLGTALFLFAFDEPVESSSARLHASCGLEAAPLFVRCSASF